MNQKKKQIESSEQNLVFQKKDTDDWGVNITDDKDAQLFSQSFPVQLEFYHYDTIVKDSTAYTSVEIEGEVEKARIILHC